MYRHEVRLSSMIILDVLKALCEEGYPEKADAVYLSVAYPLMAKGFTPLDPLLMEADELVREFNTPPGKPGWNTVWGKRVTNPEG